MSRMATAQVTGEISTAVAPWTLAAAAVWLAVGVVWMGLALGAVYRRVDGRSAWAWIPVLRYVEMAHVTQSSVGGTAAARGIAAVGFVTWAVGATVPGGASVALAGLAVAAVAGIAAWGMWIVQTRRFGMDHSLPAALPVLAAVAPGIWAAVVGWSGMIRTRASGPVQVAPEPAAPEPAAPVPERPAPASPASAPEPMPEDAAEEVWPGPVEVASPETAPIPVRRSPYASLAPRDLPATGELPVRRSPYASLTPREIWEPPAEFAAHVSDSDAIAPAEPAVVPAETAPEGASDAAPAGAGSSESAAWEAALGGEGDLARPAPDADSEDDPADAADSPRRTFLEEVVAAAATGTDESAAGEAPAPASTSEAGEGTAEVPRPVYVEPTPTLPVSPYMRGGAAAPPPVPTTVPTFEAPTAPVPVVPTPQPAAEPLAEPEPTFEPEPAPEQAPEPTFDPAPAPASSVPSPLPAPPGPAPQPAPAFEDDRTQVSTRQREAWELVTSEGGVHRFDSATVVVGRVGGMFPVDGTPRLDIQDSTRTISKSHARLTLGRGGWSVEDLGSTNGTYLVDEAGNEAQVPAGTATPVQGRLILGDVEIEIRRREAQA